jgi:hypothetical protein
MSRTSLRVLAISTFAAVGLATIGTSAVSAFPISKTSIGVATAASSLVTHAGYEFYVENGRCYMRARLTSRPMPMSKCAAVQHRPPAH